jgi:hypothetical protein
LLSGRGCRLNSGTLVTNELEDDEGAAFPDLRLALPPPYFSLTQKDEDGDDTIILSGVEQRLVFFFLDKAELNAL